MLVEVLTHDSRISAVLVMQTSVPQAILEEAVGMLHTVVKCIIVAQMQKRHCLGGLRRLQPLGHGKAMRQCRAYRPLSGVLGNPMMHLSTLVALGLLLLAHKTVQHELMLTFSRHVRRVLLM